MKGDCKYIVDRLKNSMVFNYPIYITLFLNLKCYNSPKRIGINYG
jgi:hypothetical protein